jgi:elongation factor P--beta-lysine ligase
LEDKRERPLCDAISLKSAKKTSLLQTANAKTLNDTLSVSIDEVLTDLLGRKARQAVYDYLARNCSLAKEDIPENLEKFFEVAEEAFGKGSRTIAKCVVKRLFKKLEWKFEDIPGFEFQDYLEMARARIARELVEKARADILSRRLE